MDPHSFGCPGSGFSLGMRIRIQEHENRSKFTKRLGFLLFKKALVPSLVCLFTIKYFYVYFACKKSTFQRQSLTRIWTLIRMDPHLFSPMNPDPYQHWTPMRIDNTELFTLFFLHPIILISGVPSLLTTSAARLSGEDMNANQSL
jgi:hypothetical protein